MYFSYHHPYVIIPLIIFQINPFAMAHQYLRSERISHGYLHSFMMYLGLWDTELEKGAQDNILYLIAIQENNFQLFAYMVEMLSKG